MRNSETSGFDDRNHGGNDGSDDAMTGQALELGIEGDIATITFCRPEVRNAIGETLIADLEQALDRVERLETLRALIITGAGNCFMAGGDIAMMRAGLERPYEFFLLHDRITRIGMRLERLRIPVIAAINGYAFGGGLELALACDFRIMAEGAKLGLPEVGLGIMPGSGGTARLVRVVGREQAFYLELTGQPVNAREAHRIGLAGQVVPDDRVLQAARELAGQIAARAPIAVTFIKRAVTLAADMPLEGAVDYCQYAALFLSVTQDCREGFAAFLEKRPPQWRGR
ncbi:MAG: enoyl-CoA hydratase/isomerase family protein [Gammaproteobacteria bacterium]|nr:enoyl-CoA hydratase/isomerase family protein [Gammaproteobacteria bacterium]